MSVGWDKSLGKEPRTQHSNAASINCHLCGAKFKVWDESSITSWPTLEQKKDRTRSESQK